MHVLIAGGDRVDAGKTTFAAGFLRWHPADLSAFKPRAGNDYWFDHDAARSALADGRLHGKDVVRLLAAEGTDDPPAERNPIHRLWRPTPDRTGMLGERGRTFCCDRVSTPDGRAFVVNEADPEPLPDPVREALPVAAATRVSSRAALDETMESLHLSALTRLRERVREEPNALVEAYANVATPLRGVSYDAIAVVEPGRVRIYDGERWAVARDAARDPGRGRLETRTSRITDLLDPSATRSLPPAPGETRTDPDRLAALYEETYERLWQVARETNRRASE